MPARRPFLFAALVFLAALAVLPSLAAPDAFHFVILGDRTGEVQPGVYEQVWKEIAASQPAFVVGVGDTIQGGANATAEREWQAVTRLLAPYRRIPLYLAPGNHDIWSAQSEELFRKYAARPTHYSFDQGPVHITVLDNSRSDNLADSQMAFLEKDLAAHAAQPLKFILSHRPSWIVNAAFGNPQFPFHQLAKKYKVPYVIAGHIHEMLHIELEGIDYVSVASSGGHLRSTMRYEDGWFFGYTDVAVNGTEAAIRIHELKPPHGRGRVTNLKDWGRAGLQTAR